MTADTAAVLLVLLAAPPATAFPIAYGFTAKWWKSSVGWGLLMSSSGLALLIDISLLYNWLGDDYYLRDVVRLSVYSAIVAGCWLTFFGWLNTRLHLRRHRH